MKSRVYGFKPSFGVASLKGIQTDPDQKTNRLQTLAVSGHLARNIDDLELVLNIIARLSSRDQRLVPINSYLDTIDIQNIKIAWTYEFGGERFKPLSINLHQLVRQ